MRSVAQALDLRGNLEGRVFRICGEANCAFVALRAGDWASRQLARKASRLSTASICSLKTWPNWRAASCAMASRLGNVGGVGNFPFEARHRLVGDAAGIDELEVAQVGGDIKGEAVGSDAARDMNADGADLALALAGRADLWMRSADSCKTAPDAGEAGDAAGAARRRRRRGG